MATDRSILKNQQAGALNSVASSTPNAIATISGAHSRPYNWTKAGAENSSNNVGESSMFTVLRAGVVKSVKLATNSAVSANATNGFVITVAKRTAGAAAVPVATYNNDTAAQGAITAFSPASLSVVTSSDSAVAAGDVLTFKCIKFGTGSLLDAGSCIVVDVEEV